MIYLDNAATTKPSEAALKVFNEISRECWGNPSSVAYEFGIQARRRLEEARQTIANCIGADRPEQIIFTSGSTEGANMVIRNYRQVYSSDLDHPCIRNTRGEGSGFSELYCITHINNETGMFCAPFTNADAEVLLDATQSAAHGLLTIDDHVDYAIASAHKFGGFKGTGFLYVKYPGSFSGGQTGGHQEFGLRAGTENVAGICAMAAALNEVYDHADENFAKLEAIRGQIVTRLVQLGATINPRAEEAFPGIISATLPGYDAQAIIALLSERGIYVSAGSACSTGENKPSRVLKALGLTDDEARATIRISPSPDETHENIDIFLKALEDILPWVKLHE